MKDNFSVIAGNYSRFRPDYPDEIFEYLLNNVVNRQIAWDCATGNGQVAKKLSPYFDQVYATDISTPQLEHAFRANNIFYSAVPAENSGFAHSSLDLITVGQAIHWFEFDLFYNEVKRTLKQGGLFAVLGYGQIKTGDKTDVIIDHLYENILYGFWDPERRFLDENYKTIPFPFTEIPAPSFEIRMMWTFRELLGYLETWSAVQHYMTRMHSNPLDRILPRLKKHWPANDTKQVVFPVFLRAAAL